MDSNKKTYLIGGGIGFLAAAAFMGGSLDGTGNPEDGYSLRGGRMMKSFK